MNKDTLCIASFVLLLALCFLTSCVERMGDDGWLDSGRHYFCPDCQGRAHLDAIGTCSRCGDMTSSISFKYCYECAKELDRCQYCGRPRWFDRMVP